MSYEEVVILSAVRTPIGSFCGQLSSLSPQTLGATVIKEVVNRAGLNSEDISEVLFGNVLTAGHGQNPARQASVAAGLSYDVPATSVNVLCGSGLKTVVMAAQAIKAGDADFIVAGGQESMSQAQHSMYLRNGTKTGSATMVDTMLHDGLTDAFHDIHMGITAENIAKQWSISREKQDALALESQMRTARAQEQGLFDLETVPVQIGGRKPMTVTKDEYPRNDMTKESLQKLKPFFIQDGTGTVTPGNASGINDGAAAVVVASKSAAAAKGLKPLAKIVSYGMSGCDPSVMGIGPVNAVRKSLQKAGWTIDDVDFFELNEAFAAQAIAVSSDLNIPEDKVNVHGGAIALGHPIGASGARVLVTLLNVLRQHKKTKGVAGLCIGGGMGIAMCIELYPDV